MGFEDWLENMGLSYKSYVDESMKLSDEELEKLANETVADIAAQFKRSGSLGHES
jgi:hypothetical protein